MEPMKVVRVKRKASDEPAEALVIALKKPKFSSDDSVRNEVYLKLATTVKDESEVVHSRVQEAIARDRLQRVEWGKSPKTRFNQPLSQRLHALHKAQSQKRREELFSARRLILTQSLENKQDQSVSNSDNQNAQANDPSYLFRLYDIIEENEEVKPKQLPSDKPYSAITCNGVPLVSKLTLAGHPDDYVYDVYYVATGNLDERFVEESVSVAPYTLPDEELIPPEDEPEEYYEDEDDSNDEDNWRNDYPDEDSDFENRTNYYNSDYEYDDDIDNFEIADKFKQCCIDVERYGPAYAAYKARILADEDD